MTCVFCTDPTAAGEIVFEDDATLVILHPDSSVRGHAMVVAKRHVQNVSDLNRDEWVRFAAVQQAAERALLDETRTERAILLKLGIQTPHLHVHVYPVSAALDRAAVQKIIDGLVSEPRDPGFGGRIRERLTPLLR